VDERPLTSTECKMLDAAEQEVVVRIHGSSDPNKALL